MFGNTPGERRKNIIFFFLTTFTASAMMLALLILVWWYVPRFTSKSSLDLGEAEYQSVYLTWVANKYAETKNLSQAEKELANWKREDLASFLPLLSQQTPDPETRRRIIALRDALRLPVPQSDYTSAQWSADYQKLYIIFIASEYWRTGDIAKTQKALASWNRDDLAKQLLELQRSAKDAETRRNLVVLTEALRLPFSESSLILFIVEQPGIVLGVLVATIPLFLASASMTMPRIKRIRKRILKRIGVKVVEEKEAAEAGKPVEESLDDMLAQVQATEAEAADSTAAPGEQQAEEKKEEKSEEESEEQSSGLGDLASLFEEEDTSVGALEAFCKGMAEINIDELLTTGSNILYQLRQGNRLGERQSEKRS
ncbi:MAG: hypothetical protein HZB51_24935 [Chloroflexi bacterium]|nr:hypothetical protein [Chloroflexota bacterium]